MLTKTKIALATALVAATGSVALASEFDPNLANRYPAYADPIGSHSRMSAPVQLRTRDAALSTRPTAGQLRTRNVALPARQGDSQDWFEINRSDRASSPYAGGN